MTTVNPLSIALSGLKVAQSQLSVTSNNIANVATDGYSRKTLSQVSQVIGGEGAGATVGQVQRRINDILLKDYRTQISLTTGLQTRANYMNQIQEIHGPPDAEQAISNELGRLKDSFAQLTNAPENPFALQNVYTKATQIAEQFNDFSDRIVEMRNNAQSEITQSVNTINALTGQIADLNRAIKVASSQDRPIADMEDQRDLAIRELAKEIDVSYYKTSDNVVTVMTREGQLLADINATPLYFNQAPQGPQTYYPVSASPIMLGNPVTGTDLTTETTLGGRLGELARLRDETLPTYNAQIDELAHKMAMRFESQGLRLFTLPDGTVPANIPTSYVGFASDVTINPAIVADIQLLRKGTTPGSTVQEGSNEVLRKIVEFAFGGVAYQEARGTADISQTGPVPPLFTTLGISGQARLLGTTNIQSLNPLDTSQFINPGTNDTFTLQVGAAPAQTITITAGMTAGQLVTAINTAIPGTAKLGTGGELILTGTDDITIGAGTLGASGLAELGLQTGVTAAVPPSFQIAVGNNDMMTIEILDTDTAADLLTKLNNIVGLDATLTSPDGFLLIQPEEGGDITLVDGLGAPLDALGISVNDIKHAAFNSANLGPGGNLNGRIQTGTTLHDYASQAVSLQSQDGATNDVNFNTEDTYRAALEKQMLDTTGVNLDEEMALLISIQTAYNASARTVNVVQQMLDELMNTIR